MLEIATCNTVALQVDLHLVSIFNRKLLFDVRPSVPGKNCSSRLNQGI